MNIYRRYLYIFQNVILKFEMNFVVKDSKSENTFNTP